MYEPKVEKLGKSGYNISDISEYAKQRYLVKDFNEVFAEHRVNKYLKR